MFKSLLCFFMILISCTFCYSGDSTSGIVVDFVTLSVQAGISVASTSGIAVASTATVRGKSTYLPTNSCFSFAFKCSSSGTVNVQIELEQDNELPTTEGSSDTDYVVPEDTSGDSVGLITTITDTNTHIINFAPVATGYCRLKITGLAGNDASTVLTKAKMYYVKG